MMKFHSLLFTILVCICLSITAHSIAVECTYSVLEDKLVFSIWDDQSSANLHYVFLAASPLSPYVGFHPSKSLIDATIDIPSVIEISIQAPDTFVGTFYCGSIAVTSLSPQIQGVNTDLDQPKYYSHPGEFYQVDSSTPLEFGVISGFIHSGPQAYNYATWPFVAMFKPSEAMPTPVAGAPTEIHLADHCASYKDTTGIITDVSNVPPPNNYCSLTKNGRFTHQLQNAKIVCDCFCEGYWADDSSDSSGRKCTKCGLVCPAGMEPNQECTGCQCVSCQQPHHYTIFSMVYLETDNQSAVDFLLGNGSSELLQSLSASGANFRLENPFDSISKPIAVNGINISRVLPTNSRVFKVAFDVFTLNDFTDKLDDLQQLFKDSKIASSAVANISEPSIDWSSLVNNQVSYTDNMNTFCAKRSQLDENGQLTIAPSAAFHQACPTALDAKENGDESYWSTCVGDRTISQNLSIYEDAMNYIIDSQVDIQATAKSVRRLYPQCYDFLGKDLTLFGVKCTPPTPLFFSTTTNDIFQPQLLFDFFQTTSFVDTSNTNFNIKNSSFSAYSDKSNLPIFPRFPQIMWMLCDNSKTVSPTPSNVVPLTTSLSPTVPTAISWNWLGAEISPLLFTLNPTSPNPDKFLFSSYLGFEAGSAQVIQFQLGATNSNLLAKLVYDDINATSQGSGGTPNGFSASYSAVQSTIVASPTKDASNPYPSTLTVSVNYPNLCQINNIICDDENQFCNAATGQCECKTNFNSSVLPASTQNAAVINVRLLSSQVGGTQLTEKNRLSCTPKCNASGQTYDAPTDSCKCDNSLVLWSGSCIPSSDLKTVIRSDKTQAQIHSMCNNGYDKSSQCTCFPNWKQDSDCLTCLLKPSAQSLGDKFLQTSSQLECYGPGTDPITYESGNCQQCLCKRGYTGQFCHLHEVYTRFVLENGQDGLKIDLQDTATYQLLEERTKINLQYSFPRTVMDKYRLTTDKFRIISIEKGYLILGIQSGVDYFARNLLLNPTGASTTSLSISSTPLAHLRQSIFAPLADDSSLGDLNNLYNQWNDFQNSFNQTAAKNSDLNDSLGGIKPDAPAVYDPGCNEQYPESSGCSKGVDVFSIGDVNSTPAPSSSDKTTLIIAIVVSIGGAIILFILLIVFIHCAKKHHWCCFAQKSKQDATQKEDVHSLTRKGSASQASGGLVAMSQTSSKSDSATTTNAIQASNNQVPVEDSTLPSGWQCYKNDQGKLFYVNTDTSTSQWHHPVSARDSGNGW